MKKKRKTLITFVSLIFTTFDRIVMPLGLIPFLLSPVPPPSPPPPPLDLPVFLVLTNLSLSLPSLLSSPSFTLRDTTTGDEEGLRIFLNTESRWQSPSFSLPLSFFLSLSAGTQTIVELDSFGVPWGKIPPRTETNVSL